MVEEAPAAPSETSPTSVVVSASSVWPMCDSAAMTCPCQSAIRRTGARSVCQLRPGSPSPSASASRLRVSGAFAPSASPVPAAPESETQSDEARKG